MKQLYSSSLTVLSIVIFLNSHAFAAKRLPIKSQTRLISDQVQLFLDDELIDWRVNVKRQLQKPTKHPANPLLRADQPWETYIGLYGSVMYDPDSGKFRCWYLAKGTEPGLPDTPEGPVTVEYYQCYAESADGIHWEKPPVGFKAYGPHKNTNIVINNSHSFSILRDPAPSDPNKKYLGAGGAIFGFSPDGIHWTKQSWDAVGKNDTGTSVIKWHNEFLAFVRNQEEDHRPKNNLQRAVALCISNDFEHWTYKQTIFMTDKEDGSPWTQPYGMSVTPYGDQLIGLMFMLYLDPVEGNNMFGDMNIQILTSRDGRNWSRVADRAVFLEGTTGSWDGMRIMSPAASMFVKDDLVYIYYNGSNTRHGDKKTKSVSCIGLATLPADRFVSFQPENPEKEAILETCLLQFTGGDLILNAETQPEDLRVELIDPHGLVVEGFDRSTCKLTKQDALRYRVTWNTPAGEKSLADARTIQPLALRFILKENAKVYAFQIR